MNRIFDTYARYYDLLYKDKDYAGESEYISSHIRNQIPDAKRILELGCGTGGHAEHLARTGFTVHGVDMSEGMVKCSETRKAGLPSEVSERLSFGIGDMRNLRAEEFYDVVVSLFHVMSYQTSNDDLQAAIATAKAHLNPGGLFIFDFWYGPAVLSDPPVVCVKKLDNNEIEVLRTAEPVIHHNDNVVDVNYKVLITETATGKVEQVNETHRMRYIFLPEITNYLTAHGFNLLRAEEWLSGKAPGNDTWNVCCVAQCR